MGEGSAIWDCDSGGDSAAGSVEWDAPYSGAEMANLFSILFNSDDSGGLVIPGLDNMLVVEEAAVPAMSVVVGTGYMFSRGRWYVNDSAKTVTITNSDPVNPRLDRIVARMTVGSSIIRIVVVTGVAATPPALPALTTTAAVWEVDIAHVYVQGNTLTITDEDIDDKRTFYNNGYQANYLLSPNLLINSEYMAYSALSAADPTTYPPDYWQLVGTPSAMTRTTRLDQMSRGGAVDITTDAANEGQSQTIKVKPDTWYAIKGCYNVTSGDVGKVVVTTDSAAPNTITRELRRVSTDLEVKVYYLTESDAEEMTLQLLGLNSGDVVDFGQFLIVEGFDAGPFREIHETLLFQWNVHTDTNYENDTFNVGTYTIDFDADYGTYILPGTRAVYMDSLSNDIAPNSYQIWQTVTTNTPLKTILWSATYKNSFCVWLALDENRQIEFQITTAQLTNLYVHVAGIMT